MLRSSFRSQLHGKLRKKTGCDSFKRYVAGYGRTNLSSFQASCQPENHKELGPLLQGASRDASRETYGGRSLSSSSSSVPPSSTPQQSAQRDWSGTTTDHQSAHSQGPFDDPATAAEGEANGASDGRAGGRGSQKPAYSVGLLTGALAASLVGAAAAVSLDGRVREKLPAVSDVQLKLQRTAGALHDSAAELAGRLAGAATPALDHLSVAISASSEALTATSILLRSLSSVLSGERATPGGDWDRDWNSGSLWTRQVAATVADLAANEVRRRAVVQAGDGRVVDWLLELVGGSRGRGPQEEAARALACILGDPHTCEWVLGRRGAISHLLQFAISSSQTSSQEMAGGSAPRLTTVQQPRGALPGRAAASLFDAPNQHLPRQHLRGPHADLVAAIMDFATIFSCSPGGGAQRDTATWQPRLPAKADRADIAAALAVLEESSDGIGGGGGGGGSGGGRGGRRRRRSSRNDSGDDDGSNGGSGIHGIGIKVGGGTGVVGISMKARSPDGMHIRDNESGGGNCAAATPAAAGGDSVRGGGAGHSRGRQPSHKAQGGDSWLWEPAGCDTWRQDAACCQLGGKQGGRVFGVDEFLSVPLCWAVAGQGWEQQHHTRSRGGAWNSSSSSSSSSGSGGTFGGLMAFQAQAGGLSSRVSATQAHHQQQQQPLFRRASEERSRRGWTGGSSGAGGRGGSSRGLWDDVDGAHAAVALAAWAVATWTAGSCENRAAVAELDEEGWALLAGEMAPDRTARRHVAAAMERLILEDDMWRSGAGSDSSDVAADVAEQWSGALLATAVSSGLQEDAELTCTALSAMSACVERSEKAQVLIARKGLAGMRQVARQQESDPEVKQAIATALRTLAFQGAGLSADECKNWSPLLLRWVCSAESADKATREAATAVLEAAVEKLGASGVTITQAWLASLLMTLVTESSAQGKEKIAAAARGGAVAAAAEASKKKGALEGQIAQRAALAAAQLAKIVAQESALAAASAATSASPSPSSSSLEQPAAPAAAAGAGSGAGAATGGTAAAAAAGGRGGGGGGRERQEWHAAVAADLLGLGGIELPQEEPAPAAKVVKQAPELVPLAAIGAVSRAMKALAELSAENTWQQQRVLEAGGLSLIRHLMLRDDYDVWAAEWQRKKARQEEEGRALAELARVAKGRQAPAAKKNTWGGGSGNNRSSSSANGTGSNGNSGSDGNGGVPGIDGNSKGSSSSSDDNSSSSSNPSGRSIISSSASDSVAGADNAGSAAAAAAAAGGGADAGWAGEADQSRSATATSSSGAGSSGSSSSSSSQIGTRPVEQPLGAGAGTEQTEKGEDQKREEQGGKGGVRGLGQEQGQGIGKEEPPSGSMRKHAARLLALLAAHPPAWHAVAQDEEWTAWLERCADGQVAGNRDDKSRSYARQALLHVAPSHHHRRRRRGATRAPPSTPGTLLISGTLPPGPTTAGAVAESSRGSAAAAAAVAAAAAAAASAAKRNGEGAPQGRGGAGPEGSLVLGLGPKGRGGGPGAGVASGAARGRLKLEAERGGDDDVAELDRRRKPGGGPPTAGGATGGSVDDEEEDGKEETWPRYADGVYLVDPSSAYFKQQSRQRGAQGGSSNHTRTAAALTGQQQKQQQEEEGEDVEEIVPAVDVVFIHGLRGGPFKTWRVADDKTSTVHKGGLVEVVTEDAGMSDSCWPSQWLSRDLPPTRMLSIKYKTNLTEWTGATLPLQELSEGLLEKLTAAGVGERPVVFITHSMGGLVVKQMLAYSLTNPRYSSLVQRTAGIVFYSCPHFGSKLADMPWRMGYLLRPAPSVEDLRRASPRLEELNKMLRHLHQMGHTHVLSFAETKLTPLVRAYGGLALAMEVVPIESAYPGFGGIVVLHGTDHVNSCKPASRDDPAYLKTLEFLRMLCASAEKSRQDQQVPLSKGKLRP